LNAVKDGARARALTLAHETEEAACGNSFSPTGAKCINPPKTTSLVISSSEPPKPNRTRRRAQFNFDVFMASTGGGSSFNWTPDQIKHHDNRCRAVLQSPLPKPALKERKREPERAFGPAVIFVVEDPTSPPAPKLAPRFHGPSQRPSASGHLKGGLLARMPALRVESLSVKSFSLTIASFKYMLKLDGILSGGFLRAGGVRP
jgi:hypothetical protein